MFAPRRPYRRASLSRAALHRPTHLTDRMCPHLQSRVHLFKARWHKRAIHPITVQRGETQKAFWTDLFFFFFILSLIGPVSPEQSRHLKVVCGLDGLHSLGRGVMWLLIASVVFFSAVIKLPSIKFIKKKKNRLQPLFMDISLSSTVITDQADSLFSLLKHVAITQFTFVPSKGGLVLFPLEWPHFIMALLCERTLHFLYFTASTFASGEPCVSVCDGPFFCWISAKPDPRRYTARTPVYKVLAARPRMVHLPVSVDNPSLLFSRTTSSSPPISGSQQENTQARRSWMGFTQVGPGLNYLWPWTLQVSCWDARWNRGSSGHKKRGMIFPTSTWSCHNNAKRAMQKRRPHLMPEASGSVVFVVLKKKKQPVSEVTKKQPPNSLPPTIGCFCCWQAAWAPLQNKATLKSKYKIKVKYEEIVTNLFVIFLNFITKFKI